MERSESSEHVRTAAAPLSRGEAWGMGAAFAILWWLSRSRVHGWDAVSYAARAADHPLLSERYLSTRLLHPHHLLYLPLARIVVAAANALSGGTHAALSAADHDPFAPLQFLSAAGAGLVVALVGLTLREG